MTDFHIGQHVVCVNDDVESFMPTFITCKKNLHGLTKGRIYTIRDFCRFTITGNLCLRLEEIIRPSGVEDKEVYDNGGEPGYHHKRFRPLQKLNVEDFMPVEEFAQ